MTMEQACERDAESYCNKTAACSAFALQSFWGDLETCKKRDVLWYMATLRLGDTGNTPDSFWTCSDAVDAQSCEDFNAAVAAPGCQFKPGKRALGRGCSNGAQCDTLHCDIVDNAACGVCATKAPIGAVCDVNSDCASGARCRQQKCVPEVGEGAACDGQTAVCAYSNTCLGATCRKPFLVGAPCDPMFDACDYGTFGAVCDGQTKTCKAVVKLAAYGQPCGVIDNVPVDCAAFGSCGVDTPDATVGSCIPPTPDGAACDSNSLCFWPSSCSGGVCRPQPVTGVSCP